MDTNMLEIKLEFVNCSELTLGFGIFRFCKPPSRHTFKNITIVKYMCFGYFWIINFHSLALASYYRFLLFFCQIHL